MHLTKIAEKRFRTMISEMMMNESYTASPHKPPPATLPRRRKTKEGVGKKARAAKNKKTNQPRLRKYEWYTYCV
jgi:hypothetical protein